MRQPVSNRDLGDEADVEFCDEHHIPLTWHEDGGGESGPQEPYLDCQKCRWEREHPILHCDTCEKESRVVSQGTAFNNFDPTTYYRLECGHTVI